MNDSRECVPSATVQSCTKPASGFVVLHPVASKLPSEPGKPMLLNLKELINKTSGVSSLKNGERTNTLNEQGLCFLIFLELSEGAGLFGISSD